MLTTTTSTTTRAGFSADRGRPTITALSVALDEAQARLDAALEELRRLIADGALAADEARALEADYVTSHLRRVATLEQRGALACSPDEWEDHVMAAKARRARIESARSRRARLRIAVAARRCLVVAAGRIDDPALAVLIDDETDEETLEIRAELAAAQLL